MMRMPLAIVLIAGLSLAATGARAAANQANAGEYIARASDCVACHSIPGGKAFAGGLKMATPVGAIFTTNITPDAETGIGTYTLKEFDAALRLGIAKDGHRLYPAMPYPSYAKLTDEDISALYNYFMHTVPAVHQPNKTNEITGLASARWPLGIWSFLFAPSPGFQPNPAKSAEWNRGAYLIEGPGHCGACHTARGFAFQEQALSAQSSNYLAGANLDDWYASNLRSNKRTGIGAWTKAETAQFLKTGHNIHASAYGSMTDVINNSTSYLTDADLSAMATYLADLSPNGNETPWAYDGATAQALLAHQPSSSGMKLYGAYCQSCHRETGAASPTYLPSLAGNPTLLDQDPSSLINIVLNGSAPLMAGGRPDAYRMPQFREQLTDQQIADVISFTRNAWGNLAPPVTGSEVNALRNRTEPASDRIQVLKMH
jgi:mono/diheme cytochrome c family protein